MKNTKQYLVLLLSLVVGNLVGADAGVSQETLESSATEELMPSDAETRVLFLQEQLRRQRALASLRERILAALPFYNSDNPRVQELVALEEAEWALREKVLKEQRKNRLQLFVNRHEQLLRMMAIASIVGIAGGLTIKKIRDKNDKNSKAYQDALVIPTPKKKPWEGLTTEVPSDARVSISPSSRKNPLEGLTSTLPENAHVSISPTQKGKRPSKPKRK